MSLMCDPLIPPPLTHDDIGSSVLEVDEGQQAVG